MPEESDVLIIGAGLVGLRLAGLLGEGGLKVHIIERRSDVCLGWSGRSTGQGILGVGDNPARLKNALGENSAGEILTYSSEGLLTLKKEGHLEGDGLHIATDTREAEELSESRDFLRSLGFKTELLETRRLNEMIGSEGLGPALRCQAEGLLDPNKMAKVELRKCMDTNVSISCGVTAIEYEDCQEGLRIIGPDWSTRTQSMVFTDAQMSRDIDPFFSDKIHPLRIQSMTLKSTTDCKSSCSAQYGYINWRDSGNHRIFSGCRWATPHLEVGESDDNVTDDRVSAALKKFVHGTFPAFTSRSILREWSGIAYNSCDGLPIIGPLPGRDDLLACCGFSDNEAGLGTRSAKALADILLQGLAPGLPKSFSARRFL